MYSSHPRRFDAVTALLYSMLVVRRGRATPRLLRVGYSRACWYWSFDRLNSGLLGLRGRLCDFVCLFVRPLWRGRIIRGRIISDVVKPALRLGCLVLARCFLRVGVDAGTMFIDPVAMCLLI